MKEVAQRIFGTAVVVLWAVVVSAIFGIALGSAVNAIGWRRAEGLFELCQSVHPFLPVRNTVPAQKNVAARLSHFATERPAAGCFRSPPTINVGLDELRLSTLKKMPAKPPLARRRPPQDS